jgi:hypothetical protein
MLKPVDREKLQDCLLLVQSARNILSGFHEDVVPDVANLDQCFNDADRTLTNLLRH